MRIESMPSPRRVTPDFARFGRWSGILPLLTALILAAPVAAQERAVPDSLPERPRVPTYDPGLPYLEKTLKNGVHLLVQEQRTVYFVAGVAAIRMGTRYETEENSGLGNVLLQTMVRGTSKSSDSEFLVRLRGNNATLDAGIGADVGEISIGTDHDHAAGAAEILADVVLSPALADSTFEAERVRASSDATFAAESPIPAAYGQFLSVMYAGTPYQRHLQGLVPAIAQARRSDIVDLHKKVTVGGNLTIVFIGNVDGKKLMSQLEKMFAGAAPGPPIEPAGPEPSPLAADTTIVKEKPWLAHACIIGYPAPGYADPDYPAFAMIDSYLRSEDRSPITYWMQVRDDAVSPGIAFTLFPTRGSIAVYFGATTEKLAAARDTSLAVLDRLRTVPLEKGEWTVQLKRVQNGFFFKQDDPLTRARMIARYVSQGQGLDYPTRFETALLHLTPEDVRAAAERWLTHSCQVYMGPAPSPPSDEKP
ncbi:MAG TPA: pitrilysin family protein [Candidatus Eisenbacteria bacterium]|nr:pitrilysin family protein [Candidatus Eisenbacteria bacterium]